MKGLDAGRVIAAPESHLPPEQLRTQRRNFLRRGDPAQHRLMIHGLVKRPLMLSMDDVMRFPSVSRIHFIECGANGGMEWANVAVPTVQYTHGIADRGWSEITFSDRVIPRGK